MAINYKSENPIVQKCLEILNNSNVSVKSEGVLYNVYLNNKILFGIGMSGPLFVNNISFAVNTKDIDALTEKCKVLSALQQSEHYPSALKWLDEQLYQNAK